MLGADLGWLHGSTALGPVRGVGLSFEDMHQIGYTFDLERHIYTSRLGLGIGAWFITGAALVLAHNCRIALYFAHLVRRCVRSLVRESLNYFYTRKLKKQSNYGCLGGNQAQQLGLLSGETSILSF